MRHKLPRVFFALLFAASALAQTAPGAGDEPRVERLRAHVRQLASEEFQGRRTGTEGALKAAAYVEAEFRRLGLKPGRDSREAAGGAGTARPPSAYLQPFPYVAAVEPGRRNAMGFKVVRRWASGDAQSSSVFDMRLGEDWSPVAWGANGKVETGDVVFVGYGITASELSHDDYAGADVRGKLALALAGTPDGDNPHGPFARFTDPRFKAAAARDHGAAALLIVTREENFKDDRLSRPRADESLAAAGDAGLPVVLVSRQVARQAVEAATLPSVTLENLERAAAAKPAESAAGGAGRGGGAAGQPAAEKSRSLPLPNVAFSLETDVVRKEAPASNVVGILEGSDPKLKEEAVVVGAHYDHLGTGGQGSLAVREGEVHHGADDNASGVAALLEIARVLSNAPSKPRRTIVFVAFGGEEEGLIGSSHYARNPAVPLAQTAAMINLDMIGRLKEDKLIVGGVGTAAEWREMLNDANTELKNLKVNTRGMTGAERRPGDIALVTGTNGQVIATGMPTNRFSLTLDEDGFGPSDHSSFYARQVPVLFLWTGTHEDYHKPSDTAERVNYDGLARVAAFARDLVRSIDEREKRPTYKAAAGGGAVGRSASFRVYLGTVPSYAEGDDGLKLDGVREGSPAERAGLKAGDVIVRLAGRDVKNVYDYTYALGEMKAGEEYEVEIVRGGGRLKLKLTPAARR